jgi:regulator of sigma E protease
VPWQIAKAAVGLGLVIFLHELGHFAVAKWCDVHVETFSLGFGPAIPGLSFRKGETLYKIAWIPLGGYVKMVGEGSDTEEDDDNPRSFKNKTVGQRMAIISAGVVMNVLLGCICFILAYQSGVKQTAAVVGQVEPGSPAWKKGVRSGDVIEHIGDVEHPMFEDLLYVVMLSREGQEFRMTVHAPRSDEQPREFLITPRRDASDSKPVIGIAPPVSLTVLPKRYSDRGTIAPAYGAARAARALALKPGDTVVAATDPDDTRKLKPLTPKDSGDRDRADLDALCELFVNEQLAGKPIVVRIRHSDGADEEMELAPFGFEYGDVIVGTTSEDQGASYDPYKVSKLEDDPRNPQPGHPNYFEFSRRMQSLAGKPVVLLVRRAKAPDSAPLVPVLVPPAFHKTIDGLRMKMGKVKAIREGSPAEQAAVQSGDRIVGVELTAGTETFRVTERDLDPLRLPFVLRQWAQGRSNVRAKLTVARNNAELHKDGERTELAEVPWDDGWRFDQEVPLGLASPLAIPELGLAYQVETLVDAVEKGSVAQQAGLEPGDVILTVAFKDPDYENGEKFGPETELYQKKSEPEPWWASIFALYSGHDMTAVKLKVRRGTEELEKELTLQPDPTWPLAERGLRLPLPDWRLQKADGPLEAVVLGTTRTYWMIFKTYMSLRSMVTNRISPVKNLRGPISIFEAAFNLAGESFGDFMFFLAIISVNLAVINFLPIPVLDGGHMVFLIYEKLRGRPASEQIRVALTTIGVVFILSLMAFVIFLDVKRKWFPG